MFAHDVFESLAYIFDLLHVLLFVVSIVLLLLNLAPFQLFLQQLNKLLFHDFPALRMLLVAHPDNFFAR